MKSLLALLVTVLTACAIAHPGDRTFGNQHVRRFRRGPVLLTDDDLSEPMTQIESDLIGRDFAISQYPRYLVSGSRYLMDHSGVPFLPPQTPPLRLLNEEIERIGHMPETSPILYKSEAEMPWLNGAYERIIGPLKSYAGQTRHPSSGYKYTPRPIPSQILINAAAVPRKHPIILGRSFEPTSDPGAYEDKKKERKIFASTPMDEEYFAPTKAYNMSAKTSEGPHEGVGQKKVVNEVDRRQIRQNPNLSRAKTLVAEDLDKLRRGVNSDNLGSTADPTHIHVLGAKFRRETVNSVSVAAGVATAIILSITALSYGFYVLVKRAKAAAAVDYPAYGVTGPNVDSSEDRRLAQSAQMYHYQHQKQQIIAMERNTTEQRSGSMSDPESEEENEEGDYTVYECPGFATTGAMEVRNPLFDEPTPATPGKVQVVQPQPKE